MKIIKLIVSILVLSTAFSVHAESNMPLTSSEEINNYVDEYYNLKTLLNEIEIGENEQQNGCIPSSPNCMDVSCSHYN